MQNRPIKSRLGPPPDHQVTIGIRVAYLRKMARMKQSDAAEQLGVTRALIANVESGRSPLRFGLGWKICKLFDIHPRWLLSGHWGPMGELPFPPNDTPWLEHIEKMVVASADVPFFDGFAAVVWLLGRDAPENTPLTPIPTSEIMPSVKFDMDSLLDQARRLTREPGQKSALAAELGVRPSRITEWLSAKCEPDGRRALLLLKWVSRQYSKQQTGPASASTRAEPKTQSTELHEKQSKRSSPPK